jgi:hypothetical protein
LVPVSIPINRSERVIRSDVSEAHRLSLSARVLSALNVQVKAKQQREKHFCHLQNQHSAAGRSARQTQAAAAEKTARKTDQILILSG